MLDRVKLLTSLTVLRHKSFAPCLPNPMCTNIQNGCIRVHGILARQPSRRLCLHSRRSVNGKTCRQGTTTRTYKGKVKRQVNVRIRGKSSNPTITYVPRGTALPRAYLSYGAPLQGYPWVYQVTDQSSLILLIIVLSLAD